MLNCNEIQKIIPHRYPFLFIDRVDEIIPGEKAIGYKNVTVNEYFFQGHFPGEMVMPGVLMIEALAQVEKPRTPYVQEKEPSRHENLLRTMVVRGSSERKAWNAVTNPRISGC